jgi:hypothetical protein
MKERKTGISNGAEFSYVWHWRTRLPARKGQRCRILAERKDELLWIEFEDGFRTICSPHAIRIAKPETAPAAEQLSFMDTL